MKNPKVAFTECDRMIINACSGVLDGLAAYLGDGYEIVLHSLDDPEHSAVRVLNGYHTGRTEGAPITNLALEMLEKIDSDGERDSITYHSRNKNGDPLWSTTIAIRGTEGKVIGLLCMNFYLETPITHALPGLLTYAVSAASERRSEAYVKNINDMVHEAVQRASNEVAQRTDVPASLKKREIVRILYERGIFSMKDAVTLVADEMGISINTVYLHLRHVRPEEGAKKGKVRSVKP